MATPIATPIAKIDAHAVVALLARFRAHGFDYWISGGWGVDALLGRQTREHADLDMAIRAGDEAAIVTMLEQDGFAITVDWRPARLALTHPDGREIDLHPLHFRDDGSARQRGTDGNDGVDFEYPAEELITGTIAGVTVSCIGPALQLRFHLGYEPQAKDRADMTALAAAGLIILPEIYAGPAMDTV